MQNILFTLLIRTYAAIGLVVGMFTCSTRVVCTPIEIDKLDSLSVRSAVEMSLSWQKFWYGDFFGSKCLIKPSSNSKLIYNLDVRNNGLGYISGTNFIIGIKPYGNRVVATISLGNTLGPCNEGELYPRVTNLKRDSKSIEMSFNRTVKSYPPFGEIPSEKQLTTIRQELRRRLPAEKIGSSDSPVYFTLGSSLDPYIIVCSRECEQNWIVDFDLKGLAGVTLGEIYYGDLYVGDQTSLRRVMIENLAARIRSKVPGVHSLLP